MTTYLLTPTAFRRLGAFLQEHEKQYNSASLPSACLQVTDNARSDGTSYLTLGGVETRTGETQTMQFGSDELVAS